MSNHLLTFGVVWALVAIFFAIMPLLSQRERESVEGGGAKGLLFFVAIFSVLSLCCFAGYWSMESKRTLKAHHDLQVRRDWEQKEEAKRKALEAMPVGDKNAIEAACSQGQEKAQAQIYVLMLANDFTVNQFRFAVRDSNQVHVITYLGLLSRSSEDLNRDGYVNRKVLPRIEAAFQEAFSQAGLKKPIVIVKKTDTPLMKQPPYEWPFAATLKSDE